MLYIAVSILVIWFFILTQGAMFSRKVVIWLYNNGAGVYDLIKRHDDTQLIQALQFNTYAPEQIALDLATGTGRASSVLARAGFRGKILGVDGSRSMLQHNRQTALVEATLPDIPVCDCSVDVIISLEALEFIGAAMLDEAYRVLKIGGRLIITNRTPFTGLMPGRCFSDKRFVHILANIGFLDIQKASKIHYVGIKFYTVYTAIKGEHP